MLLEGKNDELDHVVLHCLVAGAIFNRHEHGINFIFYLIYRFFFRLVNLCTGIEKVCINFIVRKYSWL